MGDLVIGVMVGVWLAGVAFFLFVAEDRDSLLNLIVTLLWPLAFLLLGMDEFVDWARHKLSEAREARDG